MEYALIGLVVVGLAFLVWFGTRMRAAGKDATAADVAEETADILRKQDKAGAEARAEDVVERLRKGGF